MTARSQPFAVLPWPIIKEHNQQYAGVHEALSAVLAIVDSVIDGGRTDDLLAHTSMHDLVVTAAPAEQIPHPSLGIGAWDTLTVRANGSFDPFAIDVPGQIAIEHLSATGRDERISRPCSEAVPLFWRFVVEKFGITPPRSR